MGLDLDRVPFHHSSHARDGLGTSSRSPGGARVVECLQLAARLAADSGAHEQAARLLGAAASFQKEQWIPEPDGEVATAAARAALGDGGFQQLAAEGRTLTPSQAVELALSSID